MSEMNPLEAYNAPKQSDDLNLIQEVRNILTSAGLGNNAAMYYDKHPLIAGSFDKISNVQRFNLNRYWALQLMAVDKYSEEERYCLIPNGSNEDWLGLFKAKIVPFLVANNLPKLV